MKRRQTPFFAMTLFGALLSASVLAGAEVQREIPRPLPSHPGNIFLAGEDVIIPAPPGEVETWRMYNYDDKVIAKGNLQAGRVNLGQLPVGYYKIVRGASGQFTNRTWIGVLAPLGAPTPKTSPIGIDVAMAWFFPEREKMQEVSSLCQLAGINHVRDRLLWGELEPKRGKFAAHTRYDVSAQVQSAAGLQVLQVCHVSAQWANPNPKRFPLDLRDIHAFYRAMAQRWQNEVGAFEPWNEADIPNFGGHTGSEMASLQKAAYLGLKAGNPQVTACLNVFAIHRAETLKDFQANDAVPYFDTYNLHHYERLENYPTLYADHRAVSGGKPLWVSECSVHVKWRGDERFQELSEADLRLQSERVTKTFALAIHEGAEAVFYFMLPHYTERQLQYGLLRRDLTPRPGFVALAAVGRLLADARPLGRIKAQADSAHGYLFRARPGGKEKNVAVLWSENETVFEMENVPEKCFNHLGREQPVQGNVLTLSRAPIYAVFARQTKFDLAAAPTSAKRVSGAAGNVVLQAILPETDLVLEKSAYTIATGQAKTVPVCLYNFGAKPLNGKLNVRAPSKWKAEIPQRIQLAPGERKELALTLACPPAEIFTNAVVRLTGNFGAKDKPVLSMQFVPRTN